MLLGRLKIYEFPIQTFIGNQNFKGHVNVTKCCLHILENIDVEYIFLTYIFRNNKEHKGKK